MKAMQVSSAMVAILLLTGCAHGRAADPKPSVDANAVARSIVLCRTTEAELGAQLGSPTRNGILHRAHIESWITGSDVAVHYLAVMLDDRDVVVDVYWDIPTEIPWVPTDQCTAK